MHTYMHIAQFIVFIICRHVVHKRVSNDINPLVNFKGTQV